MRSSPPLFLTLVLGGWTAGCAAPTGPVETTLVGTVVRGPIQPVCQINVTCDAPFSATFTVQQGDRVLTSFHSDAQGRFEVPLAAGTYVIVPNADAPIISPSTQTKEVVVGPSRQTTVLRHFDTGIR